MSKQVIAVRTTKTRDAATAILRKLGIKPRDYNLFITHTIEGVFEVRELEAQAHLQALTQPAKPAPGLMEKPEQPKGEKKVSCSKVASDLILAGKTNEEVWTVIAEQFKLDVKKRGYPAWYRFQLRKQGHKV
ncbi:hypothetical protein [Caudoviricetes sp.]|nr:hypothetical protein [Caudoviricetes sp.]